MTLCVHIYIYIFESGTICCLVWKVSVATAKPIRSQVCYDKYVRFSVHIEDVLIIQHICICIWMYRRMYIYIYICVYICTHKGNKNKYDYRDRYSMVAAVEYSWHWVLHFTSHMLGTSVGGVWGTTGSDSAPREVPPNAEKTTNIIKNSELQYKNAPK